MSNINKRIPSTVTRTLRISPEEMQEQVKKTTQQAVKEVSIKGFRKGKAPQHLAEKVVDHEKIDQLALNKIVPTKLEQELLSEKAESGRTRIVVVHEPHYHIKEYGWPNGKETVIEATVELYPEVYTGYIINELSVKRPEMIQVADEQVQEFLNRLKDNLKRIKQKSQNTEDAEEIVVKDEELFDALHVQSIEELTSKARQELELDAKYQSEQQFEQQLIDAITASIDTDIPDVLIQREVQRIAEQMGQQLQRIGATFEAYLESQQKTQEQWRDDVMKQARNNVLSMLALTELSQDMDIAVTEEEEAEIKKSGNKEQQDTLRLLVRQRKALEKLKELVTSR